MKQFKLLILLLIAFSSCKEETKEEVVIERGTVTDIEGNVYNTVKIGDQWWMAENLKVSRFNDGTEINLIDNTNNEEWENTNLPSYSTINNGTSGYLYNGNVVRSEKSIAPEGWHIPSDEEWRKMESYIGMKSSEVNATGFRGENEAGLLTSKNSTGWPAAGVLFGTDDFGFDARPGGCRIVDGRINIFNTTAFWWAKDTINNGEGWYRYIDVYESRIFRQTTYNEYGMSIRCVKD
jgi:uncharacterized protein (TIGR02145 family)